MLMTNWQEQIQQWYRGKTGPVSQSGLVEKTVFNIRDENDYFCNPIKMQTYAKTV